MKSLRHLLLLNPLLAACLLLGGAPAHANVSVSVNLHLGHFPELVPVPGYPVYYAPQLSANFFFYDGAYWLFEEGRWLSSHWYDGPWHYVDPFYVPAFVLRVPVRYYRVPPPWFRGWYFDAPPRWGHHWGPHWSQRRHGWEQWDRHRAPKPAPLPHRGDRYPRGDRQQELHRRHYRHTPERGYHQSPGQDFRQPPRQDYRQPPRQDFRQSPGRDHRPAPGGDSRQPSWRTQDQRPREPERARPEPRQQPEVRRPERMQQPLPGYRRDTDSKRHEAYRQHPESRRPESQRPPGNREQPRQPRGDRPRGER